jgi:L-ribulokinase
MVVDPREVRLPGITGVLRDGILPGLYGYEAGQVAVGDMLAWYVNTFGGDYGELESAAAKLRPGETGLVALDWWNGNRSILADAGLTGVIAGLTLQSSQDEIYRALLEAIALGNRRVMDNFTEHGVELNEIVACGGIAERSPLTMQLLADTSGLSVHVPGSSEIPARGSALFGAVAAGAFEDIATAARELRPGTARTYQPGADAKAVYDEVYAVYRDLYETLGRTQAGLLHDLKQIRTNQRRGA